MIRQNANSSPDPQLYPEYRFLLHEGMAAETRAFFREFIQNDLPITHLLKPGFAMLTLRLAERYGIVGVAGVEMRKMPLPADSLRGGLPGQSAIHKLTANGTTTVREQLDKHRADTNCAACRAKVDPAGFALEAFDPIGGLRDRYRSNGKGDEPPEKGKTTWRVTYKLGPKIDPSGELPDGRKFTGTGDLNALLNAHPAKLAEAFVAHLSRYATGTEVGFADRAEIRRIVERTKSRGHALRSLIHELASSEIFHTQKPVKNSR